MNFFGWK